MVSNKGIIYPESLREGDKIALLSPASVVKEEYVAGAIEKLKERGFDPILMPHAIGHESGSFSATKSERLMDLFEALEDSEIKAILCTRGGYGCCQLLKNLTFDLIYNNPKWLIGFSDVTALHALWYGAGVASVHGPMAKHLSTKPLDDPSSMALFYMLENEGHLDYNVASHKYNRKGRTRGILRGGNFAVLDGLVNTPYDMLDISQDDNEGVILFLEDIAEPIYKVNRMLWRLLLSNTLNRVKGIVFGQFTEYKPDLNFNTMEDMINEFLNKNEMFMSIPIVFNFPTGHTDFNYPLTEGAEVELDVTETYVKLRTV